MSAHEPFPPSDNVARHDLTTQATPWDALIPAPGARTGLRAWIPGPDVAAISLDRVAGRIAAAMLIDVLGPCESALVFADDDWRLVMILGDPPELLVDDDAATRAWATAARACRVMLVTRAALSAEPNPRVLAAAASRFRELADRYAAEGLVLFDSVLESRCGTVFCSITEHLAG